MARTHPSVFTASSEMASASIIRFVTSILLVLLTGYLGLVLAPFVGLSNVWPLAGLWAAIGWGGSRSGFLKLALLVAFGLIADIVTEAPLGCWVAIHLTVFIVAGIFSHQGIGDRTGLASLAGDALSLLAGFVASTWLILVIADSVSITLLITQFLVTAALYIPLRRLYAGQNLESKT